MRIATAGLLLLILASGCPRPAGTLERGPNPPTAPATLASPPSPPRTPPAPVPNPSRPTAGRSEPPLAIDATPTAIGLGFYDVA